jgi:hypothetical protein
MIRRSQIFTSWLDDGQAGSRSRISGMGIAAQERASLFGAQYDETIACAIRALIDEKDREF